MKAPLIYIVATIVGTVSITFLLVGGWYASELIPEWIGQLTWFALVILGSAWCGYLQPHRAWRWGAVVIGIQPVIALIIFYFVGELLNPSSSTGGMVAISLFVMLALLISPVPILSSIFGAAIRKRVISRSTPIVQQDD